MHRTLGDVNRAENFENPMREVDVSLSSCARSIRSTASVITGKIPGQVICDKDVIMWVEIDVSWSDTVRKKEKIIEKITN